MKVRISCITNQTDAILMYFNGHSVPLQYKPETHSYFSILDVDEAGAKIEMSTFNILQSRLWMLNMVHAILDPLYPDKNRIQKIFTEYCCFRLSIASKKEDLYEIKCILDDNGFSIQEKFPYVSDFTSNKIYSKKSADRWKISSIVAFTLPFGILSGILFFYSISSILQQQTLNFDSISSFLGGCLLAYVNVKVIRRINSKLKELGCNSE